MCVLLAVAVCALAVCAQGSVYTWTAGGGGTNTWATAANWDLGVPLSTDTAQFTGATARTVTIDASNPTIDTVNVSGPAAWTFAGTATLNVATAFNYSDTAASTIAPILAGNMSLNVSAGKLFVKNGSDRFTGGVNVGGGILAFNTDNATDSSLGDSGNGVTLGSTGGFGALEATYSSSPWSNWNSTRAITLSGNGGILITNGANYSTSGAITGTGKLIIETPNPTFALGRVGGEF
jgi:hypothetical protein